MRFLSFSLFFLISFNILGQELLIHQVEFVGNKKAKTEYLKKIIETQTGTSFRKTIANKDLMKLKRLPFVSNAIYSKTLTNNGYLIRFKIEEKLTLIPGANFYTTNNDEFAYRLSLYEYNF